MLMKLRNISHKLNKMELDDFDIVDRHIYNGILPDNIEYDNKGGVFLLLFGLVFAGAGFYTMFGSLLSSAIKDADTPALEWTFLLFPLPFIIIGLGCVYGFFRGIKYKKMLMKGEYQVATATVTSKYIRVTSDSDGNDTTHYYIKFNYVEMSTGNNAYGYFNVGDNVLLFIIDNTVLGAIRVNQ